MKGAKRHHSPRGPSRTIVNAEDLSRLHELREAWGMSIEGPLLVVGRLTGSLRDDMPNVFFLRDLTHPTDGHGLVYPQEDPRKGTQAFVAPREIQACLNPADAVTGKHWAIAELELAPPNVREQRNNPHECNVRAGTLRLLSALPQEWKVELRGPDEARLIAAFARDEIEAAVRAEILRDSSELVDQEEKNRQKRQRIEEELQAARNHADEQIAKFEEQIANGKRSRDAVSGEFQELQELLAEENERLKELRLKAEQERNIMEEHTGS